jgi:hypothetical protein
MRLLKVPTVAVVIEAADRDVSLVASKARELVESVLKRSVAELKAVLLRFPFRLTFQELLEGVFWKAGPQ